MPAHHKPFLRYEYDSLEKPSCESAALISPCKLGVSASPYSPFSKSRALVTFFVMMNEVPIATEDEMASASPMYLSFVLKVLATPSPPTCCAASDTALIASILESSHVSSSSGSQCESRVVARARSR
jgi:hypothetical protein